MLYRYTLSQEVVVDASTKEEADKLLGSENYSVLSSEKLFKGICSKEFLDEAVSPCTLANNDDCNYFDDEDK